MEPLDIAIAGCGIAGLSAALLLHRQGHRVTLYDRFAAPRPLGSGLMIQPTGLAVLGRLGLAAAAVRRGARIRRLHGENGEGAAVLEADYAALPHPGVFGLGIHRASLFAILHEAAVAEGITIRTGHRVRASTCAPQGRVLHFTDMADSPACDLVIDASGVGSPLGGEGIAYLPFGALWTTLTWEPGGPFDPALLEQRYDGARRMVGVLPTGRRDAKGPEELALFWSLRGDDHAAWQARGLAAWQRELTGLWPDCAGLAAQIADPAQLTFARYAHRTHPRPVEDRMIRIGDAWHAASPQLGQGANMALLDAWALARALAGGGSPAECLARAHRARRRHVQLYQWLTWAFTPLYQSSSAWPAVLRDLLFAPASRAAPGPRIKASLVAGLAGSPLNALGLEMPDYDSLAAASSG